MTPVMTEHKGDAGTLLLEVERTWRRLGALVRSTDRRALAKRTASGKWSIIENLRHLVFAEQVHLGHFLADGSNWNPMRLTARGKAFTAKGDSVVFRYRERQLVAEFAGTNAEGDIEQVLRSWDVIHEPIRKAVKAKGAEAQYALERHLGHLLRHAEVIEKMVARADKAVR